MAKKTKEQRKIHKRLDHVPRKVSTTPDFSLASVSSLSISSASNTESNCQDPQGTVSCFLQELTIYDIHSFRQIVQVVCLQMCYYTLKDPSWPMVPQELPHRWRLGLTRSRTISKGRPRTFIPHNFVWRKGTLVGLGGRRSLVLSVTIP
jgi:hypothetical protein